MRTDVAAALQIVDHDVALWLVSAPLAMPRCSLLLQPIGRVGQGPPCSPPAHTRQHSLNIARRGDPERFDMQTRRGTKLRKARGYAGRESEGRRRQEAAQEGKDKEPSPALPRHHHLTRCASRPAKQSFLCQPSVVLMERTLRLRRVAVRPFWVVCVISTETVDQGENFSPFLCHGREEDAPCLSRPCTNPAAERV